MAASVGAPCLQPPATATVGLWGWTTEQRRKVGWSCESCLCLWMDTGVLVAWETHRTRMHHGKRASRGGAWVVWEHRVLPPVWRFFDMCCLAKRCCGPCTPLNAMIWPNLPSKLHIWLSICGTWWTKSPTCDVRDYQDMDTFRPSCWDTW